MSRTKIIRIVVIVFVVAGAIVGGRFVWRNLRGIGPAVLPPAGNIVDQLPNTPTAANLPEQPYDGPVKLPSGFKINIFAKDLTAPRVLALDPRGVLVTSVTSKGTIVALPDADNNGVVDSNQTILSGLNRPHGLVFRCPDEQSCHLFIAETDKVVRYDYNPNTRGATNPHKIADLPSGGGHFTRTLLLHSTDQGEQLLVSIGSSCNVCLERDSRRATVMSMNLDGSNSKLYATGLRNAPFLARNFIDGAVWVTEMGRDLLGDDTPPDEINILQEGKHYGWPICYGANIHDTNFDKNQYFADPCHDKIPAHVELQAHSAPLGLAFIPEEGWPDGYGNDLLVAFHGSWNRTTPTGYKLVRIKLNDRGKSEGIEDFATGWLQGRQTLGRPVDILILPGGIMYVTDDKAGAVYRIIYKPW